MLRKSMLMTAICVSSVTLTGCSTLTTSWNSMNDLFAGVSGVVKTAFLRGPSEKSDISFAENTVAAEDGVFKTDVGEYVPAEVETIDTPDMEMSESKSVTVELFDTPLDVVDTSPVPCPDGTFLNEDNNCMSLETDTYDFPDIVAETTPVDTSPVPCPEGTYLNAENACMSLDTETFDFASELEANDVRPVIDTSPMPCPEGTFMNAENACMFLETETVDFAAETPTLTPTSAPAKEFKPDFALNVPSPTGPIDCPEGFVPNGDNACMFLGEGPQSGN